MPVSKADDDYTDGHGWAKLDQTACNELASVIASLGTREFEKHCKIVLTLYKLIGKDGTIADNIGYRTIASAAGVTESAARWMVDRLVKDEILIKAKSGKRFYWHCGSVAETTDPSVVETTDPLLLDPSETTDPSVARSGSSNTHKTVEDSQNRLSSTANDDIAASPDGGPHITEEEAAKIDERYERYLARAKELGYGDPE